MPHADPEARKAYQRAYRAKNKHKFKGYAKKFASSEKGKTSARQRTKKWRDANGKAYKRWWRSGVSYSDFNGTYQKQRGLCGICFKPLSRDRVGTTSSNHACADHCHKTGVFRGVLCIHCNAALGLLRDDPVLFDRAKAWVMR